MPTAAPGAFRLQSPPPQPACPALPQPRASPKPTANSPIPSLPTHSISKILAPRQHQNIFLAPRRPSPDDINRHVTTAAHNPRQPVCILQPLITCCSRVLVSSPTCGQSRARRHVTHPTNQLCSATVHSSPTCKGQQHTVHTSQHSTTTMAERYIPEHRRTQFKAKNTFKPDELRRRREEQQVEIRKAKREENLAKRRGIGTGDNRPGASLGAAPDSEDENPPTESQVRQQSFDFVFSAPPALLSLPICPQNPSLARSGHAAGCHLGPAFFSSNALATPPAPHLT